MPLPGVFGAIQLGLELGSTASSLIFSGWQLYQILDGKEEVVDATERATEIINALNDFTRMHHSALCEYSFADFNREIFPAAMVTYKDAYKILSGLESQGWFGNAIGFVPKFYRERITESNYYGFTAQEWAAAKAAVEPCALRPSAPPVNPQPPTQVQKAAWSIGEQLLVGVALLLAGVYISRKKW
jgi:hypothetical protein